MPEEPVELTNPPEILPPSRVEAPGGTISTLGRTLGSVLVVGRGLLARRRTVPVTAPATAVALIDLCRLLLEHRGEASGLALAVNIAAGYQRLPERERGEFFTALANDFEVDRDALLQSADHFRMEGSLESLWALKDAVEAPRQTLFRRINMAPEGTRTLVAMRGHLLEMVRFDPALRGVEHDLRTLFFSWFNKGFLELRRIDWSSPASVLENIIRYDAVHEINGWDDLRSRLRDDRRCFAFFHPALRDEPLIFVEIALTDAVPTSLEPLLDPDRELAVGGEANTVVFYSICNCHPGLVGISFGYFLIKAVVEALQAESASFKTFVTLSPVPGFRQWLLDARLDGLVAEELVERVREPVDRVVDARVYDALIKLCAHYLMNVKAGPFPRDATARFHLGNGAQLHGVHGGADRSTKGLGQSAGIMVNYLYDLRHIEANHEAYIDEGTISVSRDVSRLLD